MGEGGLPVRLPLRCTFEPDESLSGFVQRLALRNGMDNATELTDQAGLNALPLLSPTKDQLSTLAIVSGVDAGVLASAGLAVVGAGPAVRTVVLDGVEMPYVWMTPGMRVCTACLAGSPHHRRRWHLAIVGSCSEHGLPLIDACPACRGRLEWRRGLLPQCYCGADLRKSSQGPVDGASEEVDAWLWDLGVGRPAPRLLASWPFVAAVEFTAAVGEVLLGRRAGVGLVLPQDRGRGCLREGFRALDGDMEAFDACLGSALAGPDALAVYGGLSRLMRAAADTGSDLLVPFVMLLEARFEWARDQVLAAIPGSPLGDYARRIMDG